MQKKSVLFLGIDNGVSGSMTIMDATGRVLLYEHVPTYKEVKWTKPKTTKTKSGKKTVKHDYITLVDIDAMQRILVKYTSLVSDVYCFLERPAISYAAAWSMQTSISAGMSWAYVTYVLKKLKINRTDIDSKMWQKAFIPEATGEKNKEYMKTLKAGERNKLLKEASDMFAKSIWPGFSSKELGGGDSVCIAEYGRRTILGLYTESFIKPKASAFGYKKP